MWVVMTSAAHMPQSCKGRYRNVALVLLDQYHTARNLRPAMISERAKGVLRVEHFGHHNVGKTDKCAYARALERAERIAFERNNAPTVPDYSTWGGSA